MPRSINATLLTDTRQEAAEYGILVEFQFGSGTLRLTTAEMDLLWNGQTWLAAKGRLAFDGLSGESADVDAAAIGVTLSGVDQALLAVILGETFRGRKALVYYGHWSPTTGQVIGTPYLVFPGYMNDDWKVDEERDEHGVGDVTISTTLTSSLTELDRANPVRCNVTSHQAQVPWAAGDTFFQNVPLATGTLFWGQPVPKEAKPLRGDWPLNRRPSGT